MALVPFQAMRGGRGGFRGGSFRGRGNFNPNGLICTFCGRFGHSRANCWDLQTPSGQLSGFGGSFGNVFGTQVTPPVQGGVCGHCGQAGHGRRQHAGHPARACQDCVSQRARQNLPSVPGSRPRATQAQFFGSIGQPANSSNLQELNSLNLRDGKTMSFVFTGEIRATPSVDAQRLPGRRTFDIAGIGEENMFVGYGAYGLLTYVSLTAIITSGGNANSTENLWLAWVNTVPTTGFNRDWVRTRSLTIRVRASQLDDVEYPAPFSNDGKRFFSRKLTPREGAGPMPTLTWANFSSTTFSVRYRVELLCRNGVEIV